MLTYGIEISQNEYPLLTALLASPEHRVRIFDGEIVGRARDGMDVTLGTVDTLADTETYLAAHPTPDTW